MTGLKTHLLLLPSQRDSFSKTMPWRLSCVRLVTGAEAAERADCSEWSSVLSALALVGPQDEMG